MLQTVRTFLRESKGLALFLVLMTVFRCSFADWNTVPSGSMQPTIVEGDRILVNKLAYDLNVPFTHLHLHTFGDPVRGDIVVFDSHVLDMKLVKRVVGVPGDVIEMQQNHLLVNGEAATYADAKTSDTMIQAKETLGARTHAIRLSARGLPPQANYGPVTVPQGQYLVLGDNRDNSEDSRFIGFVPRDEIVGRTERVVLSFNYDNYYLPRPDRFLHVL